MSSSSTLRRSDSGSATAPKRVRTTQACINCRRRKRKCTPSADPNSATCVRCETQHLVCEFPAPDADEIALAAHIQLHPAPIPAYGYRGPAAPGYPGPGYPYPYAAPSRPGSTAPAPPPGFHGQPMYGPGEPLPYTGPPPPHIRPRYSNGTPYPNLALSNEQQAQGQMGGQEYGYGGYTGADYTQNYDGAYHHGP
ncbi:Zn(2)-C6 fungal-type domain-containing protein [Mycena indigotica]|uniref:Zn(2)-C6 fungal-type domain-containing protein n=1 Tax=Mycena indigotica TaxID=2126181 RepID=A0A8H6VP63_9AGAR|nr:Zn(2)-C6 fungal-type domain-containing protein [Mycena indigotica]KAF7288962.1 Zn(2)-C6 fungal-type domain-containing protein [Mycena indigotica]